MLNCDGEWATIDRQRGTTIGANDYLDMGCAALMHKDGNHICILNYGMICIRLINQTIESCHLPVSRKSPFVHQ